MTTLPAISPKESLPIGVPSEVRTGSSAPVFYREFCATRPIPLANSVRLESLLSEFESEPEMLVEMSQARRQLASTLYKDEPETLSALRLAAGLSQAQLAKLVETSQPHVARIERGVTDPGTEMIARIAHALNIDEITAFRAIRLQLSSRGEKK